MLLTFITEKRCSNLLMYPYTNWLRYIPYIIGTLVHRYISILAYWYMDPLPYNVKKSRMISFSG